MPPISQNSSLIPLALLALAGWAGISVPATAARNVNAVLPLEMSGLAAHSGLNRLYVSTQDEIRVLNGNTHATIRTIPSLGHAEIEVDEPTDRIYAQDRLDLFLIDADTHDEIGFVEVEDPENKPDMAYNRATNRLYIADYGCAADDCKSFIAVHDGDTLEPDEWITTRRFPEQVLVDPGLNRAYVRYREEPFITVIDGVTETVLADIPLPVPSRQMALNPITHMLYVLDEAGRRLSVINLQTGAYVGTYQPFNPDTHRLTGMALNPATGEIAFSVHRTHPTAPVSERSLAFWKGEVSANGFLQYAGTLEMGRIPANLFFNPATDRLYVRYGTRSATQSLISRNVLVVEDAPPVDTTPPIAAVTLHRSPNEAGWLDARGTAVDIRGIDSGGLGVDTITYKNLCSDSPDAPDRTTTSDRIENLQLSDCSNDPTITYTIRDFAGNETRGRVEVKIDRVSPTTQPVLSALPDGLPQVAFDALDSGPGSQSGVARTWYRIDNGGLTPYTGPFTVNPNRAHTIRYFSRDVAGNEEGEKTLRVRRAGDLNGDGAVQVEDAVRILQIITTRTVPTTEEKVAGDLDGSGALDVRDAVALLRRILNM